MKSVKHNDVGDRQSATRQNRGTSQLPTKAYLSRLLGSYRRAGQGRGLSMVTLHSREKRVQHWIDWLERAGRLVPLEELTADDVNSYLAHERERGQMASTIRTAYQILHAFCRWLEVEDEIPRSPMATLESPHAPKKRVPVLTHEEVAALLHACEGNSFTARRDMALIRVLLDSGLRCGELVALHVDDVNMETYQIHVRRGKGGNARITAFSPPTAVALDRYLRQRDRQTRLAQLPWLWLSQRGGISGPTVRRILRYRGERAGLQMWPHRLRHQFAHLWLASGGQERALQKLGGWENAAMLGVYGEAAAVERALEAHKKHGPGNKF